MKAYSKNPWLVENIDDFNFWCCPECAYKSKDRTVFKAHALENHPKSTVLLNETDTENVDKPTKKESEILKEVDVSNIPRHDVTINMIEEMTATVVQLQEENSDGTENIRFVTIKEDYDDGMFSGGPGTVYNDSQYTIIQDETSQDSIAATPKTENPFYQCPHCDDNFDSFDDVTNHIEDEHENNETENVVKCSECRKQLPRDHDAIKQHMRTEHMPDADFILPDKKHDKMKSSDPDKKKFACAYCGDKFPSKAVRAAHEKFAHVDMEGNLLEIPCKICQEILPSSVHFRRHCIDKHKKIQLFH